MADVLTGRGLGLRPVHYDHIIRNKPKSVQWFEVITENFIFTEGAPLNILETIRADYPIACHGVSLGIGNLTPLDKNYLERLLAFSDRFEPSIISDHLCWTSYDEKQTHDLLPIAYTLENLNRISSRIDQVQTFLNRKILLENPSAYVSFAESDFDEAEFLFELCKKTGCEVLLDLNNLYVNYKNLNMPAMKYFECLGTDQVKQFHIAGHSRNDTVLIDTHDAPACDEAIMFYHVAKERWPGVPLLLEWDDKIPEWEDMIAELERVEQKVLKFDFKFYQKEGFTTKDKTIFQYDNFYSMISQRHNVEGADKRLSILSSSTPVLRDEGMNVYNNAYFLRQRDVLLEIFPRLGKILGEQNFDFFCLDYLEAYPSEHASISFVGKNIPNFLQEKLSDDANDLRLYYNIARFELAIWDLHFQEIGKMRMNLADLEKIDPELWNDGFFHLAQPLRTIKLDIDMDEVYLFLEEAGENIHENINFVPENYILFHNGHVVCWKKIALENSNFIEHVRHDKKISEFFANSNVADIQLRMEFILELINLNAVRTIDRISSTQDH